jgi:signal transduction histidine kinase
MHLASPSRSEYVPPIPACDDHCGHAVQFYADDEFLIAKLERFVGNSLAHGDAVVTVATAAHRDRLAQRLVACGFDLAAAADQGRFISLDAADTLSLFMRDERPDPERFRELIGGTIARATHCAKGNRSRVAAYGEMVALLWSAGQPQAALELEALWNGLGKEQSFFLLCGYPLGGFSGDGNDELFLQVCAQHATVLPAESYADRGDEKERLLSIARLQARTHALEAERKQRDELRLRTAEIQTENLELIEEVRRRETSEDRLRRLTSRMLSMRDEEQRRIAAELHENTAQLLSVLQINLGLVQAERNALTPRSVDLVSQSNALVHNLLHEVRSLSHLLHPPLLDTLGLAVALRTYVQEFMESSHIEVSIEISRDLARLSNEIEFAVFRIVQESLTNVQRHSHSATATVRVVRFSESVLVEIRDQGIGGSLGTMTSSPTMGIPWMKERVRQLGGTFDIDCDSEGTIVIARLPLQPAPKE